MPRRLILIRHAKSSWADPGQEDFDRSLNARGERGARAVGDWLKSSGHVPDQVLCSSARRTRETCALLGLDAGADYLPALYHAGPDVLLDRLRAATGDVVAVIAHNPGIGAFAAMAVSAPPPHGRFADYPTCATLVADFPADRWADIRLDSARVVDFITPKELIGG